MKTPTKIKTLATMFILAAALRTVVLAQSPAASIGQVQKTPAVSPVKRKIVVSLEDRRLALLENGDVKKIYTVAVGKPSTSSPVGTFSIEHRVANPAYSHKGQFVEPGPGNPVGTRWMGLNVRGYGIHGTNAPRSIGKAASHGCIRMGKTDLEELFDLVRAGDEVEIVGRRNEETARLFASPAIPAASNAETQTAQAPAPGPAIQTATAFVEPSPSAQPAEQTPSRQ